jgi:cytidylate kinase
VTRPLVIAVDGPGSSGKGTVARAVARALGYQYVDTGCMYRATALVASRQGVSWEDAARLSELAASLRFSFSWDGDVLRVAVDGEDVTSALRRDEVGQGASRVSRYPGVRQALLGLQRSLGAAGGVVMDGRDIGTVVLPDADLKIFLDADLGERARRRHEELVQRGEICSLHEVLSALEARDRQDREREVAPLRPAPDAVLLDTTRMSIPEVVSTIVAMAQRKP